MASPVHIIVSTINWLLHDVHFSELLIVLMFAGLLALVLLLIGLVVA